MASGKEMVSVWEKEASKGDRGGEASFWSDDSVRSRDDGFLVFDGVQDKSWRIFPVWEEISRNFERWEKREG